MKIVSMEPTPSPYSMKINLNERLQDGYFEEYKRNGNIEEAPDYVRQLFAIPGVKGLYRVVDFITVERNPRTNWEEILPKIIEVIGSDEDTTELFSKAVGSNSEDAYAGVKVFIQMIRNIPTQVKLQEGERERRFALPERIMNAAMEAASASNHYLLERKWIEQSPQYGNIDKIGEKLVEELSATYSDERLEQLLNISKGSENEVEEIPRRNITIDDLNKQNWRERFAALAQMPDPTEEDYHLLNKALDDENSSVRRLATAYLGMVEKKETLPYLYKALQDKSVNVRRTAGDCLSDLGFKEAIPEMIKTLEDKSRIVRWRGAMFLYEVGDESAIPALEKALDDPEFEVRMQAKIALTRITSGKEAEGSIWQQMEQAIKRK